MSLALLALGIIALGLGSVLGYFARQTIAKKQLTTAEGKIARMLEETEKKVQETTLEAKNKAVVILEEARIKEKEREDQLLHAERRLEKREEAADKKMDDLEEKKT